jgi:two-component system LytT family response regulator
MRLLRILCVDDEMLALRRIKLLLQAMPYVEHVGEASSCAEALVAVARTSPDVLLLDIKMRDGDGFDVIENLTARANPPIVIFVTAFDHFAVRAFEHSVVDYLLKPVERERLASALARARIVAQKADAEQRLLEMQEVVRNLRNAAASRTQSLYDSEFWVRGSEGLVRVPLEAIECVSSEDDYVAFHTATGAHLMRGSLSRFETRVEPGHFVRVHRRWLVRKTAIAELKSPSSGGAEVTLRSGRKAPVGRVYLKQLRAGLRTP